MSKRPNKFFYIFIFILVLSISAVLGFLLAKWLKPKGSTSVKSASTIVTTKSSEITYKTYTNEIYGFSFQYPNTWEEKKTSSASGNEIIFQVEFADAKENIYVWVYKPKSKESLTSWLEEKKSKFQLGDQVKMTGIQGYIIADTSSTYNMNYIIEKNNYFYQLGTNYNNDNSSGKNTLLKKTSETFKLLP